MPRDDQVTRQWHVLQRLEASKRGLTLDELLAALPSDLAKHPRTLRRDLEALERRTFPCSPSVSMAMSAGGSWTAFAMSRHSVSRRQS